MTGDRSRPGPGPGRSGGGPEGPPIGEGVLARNTLWNLLGRGLPLLAALAGIPLLARGLGDEAFGVLALVWAVQAYLGELGFGRAVTKFGAASEGTDGDRDSDAADAAPQRGSGSAFGASPELVWTTAALQAGLGVLAAAALLAAADPLAGRLLRVPAELREPTATAFRLCAAAAPFLLVTTAFRGLLEARQRFDLVNAIRLPAGFASFLLPLVAVWMGGGLVPAVALLLGGRVVLLSGYAVLSFRAFPPVRRPRWLAGGRTRRRIAAFGGWASVSTVVSPVLVYLDRFLLGSLAPVRAVAWYTPPFELATRLLILPANFAATLFPAASTLAARRDADQLRRLSARGTKFVVLAVGLPAVFLAGGAHDLLRLWMGPAYAEGGSAALRILAAGVVLNAAAHVPFGVLQGVERADLTGKIHLLELPLYVAAAWWLIGAWGVAGAAVAWTLRVALDAGLLFGACHRIGAVPWSAYRVEGVGPALALVGASLAVAVVVVPAPGALWARAILLAALLTVATWTAWSVLLAVEDRRRLRRFARSLAR